MITAFSLIFFTLLFHLKYEYYFHESRNVYWRSPHRKLNIIWRIDIDTYISYVYRIFNFSVVKMYDKSCFDVLFT